MAGSDIIRAGGASVELSVDSGRLASQLGAAEKRMEWYFSSPRWQRYSRLNAQMFSTPVSYFALGGGSRQALEGVQKAVAAAGGGESVRKIADAVSWWSTFGKVLAGVGVGAVSAAAAVAAVRSAASDEALRISLAGALAQGGDRSDAGYRRAVEFAEAQSQVVLATKESISAAMALAAQQGYTGAQMEEMTRTAIGWAAIMGTDVTSAMSNVLAGVNGVGRGFNRYGLELDKLTTKEERLAALQKMAAGGYERAQTDVQGLSGALNEAGKAWAEFEESMGYALIEAAGGPESIRDMAAALREMAEQTAPAARGFANLIQIISGGIQLINAAGLYTAGSAARIATLGRYGRDIQELAKDKARGAVTPDMTEEQVRAFMGQNGASPDEIERAVSRHMWNRNRKPNTGGRMGKIGGEGGASDAASVSVSTLVASALPGMSTFRAGGLPSTSGMIAGISRESARPASEDVQRMQLDELRKIAANTGSPVSVVT